MKYFHTEDARSIFENHEDEELEVLFKKRTTGEDRFMRCVVSQFKPKALVEVVEIIDDSDVTRLPETQVRMIPLESVEKVKTRFLTYTPPEDGF